MEIDEVMNSPLTRWVFCGYSLLAAVTGVALFGWGPV